MADNFFRPGFTQGVMASGEITKNLYYNAFLGNSLNTLSISANKIDTNLMGGGSVWWEPLGGYSEPGKSVNMYDDYFAQKKARIRIGTSFTMSQRRPFFKSRHIKSREHRSLQFRRRSNVFDRSVRPRCDRPKRHLQNVGDRRRLQVERACDKRAVLSCVG